MRYQDVLPKLLFSRRTLNSKVCFWPELEGYYKSWTKRIDVVISVEAHQYRQNSDGNTYPSLPDTGMLWR